MSNDNGYEISPINPGWIHKNENAKHYDTEFIRIFLFFVVNTPCVELSSRGKDLKEYGWSKDLWRKNYLKDSLFDVAGLVRDDTFVVAKKTDEMKKACEKGIAKKGFHVDRSKEKVVIYKSKDNEFLSICHHIRNSFAHGRFSIFDEANGDEVFVMEDGIKHNGKFQVRSRMILKKTTLIKWLDILEKKDRK